MTTLAVIGGSPDHLPFLAAARDLGVDTIVFDRDPNCAAREATDVFYEVSTHDADHIIELAAGANGCLTYCSDYAAWHTVDEVQLAYRLPHWGSPPSTWHKLAVGKWCEGLVPSMRSLQGAWIVKRAEGIGGGGDSIRRLPNDFWVAQRWIGGDEYAEQGIVVDGRYRRLGRFRKGILESIEWKGDIGQRVTDALRYQCGFLSLDVIWDGECEWVIDAGPLLDRGVDRHLYDNGVDVYQMAVRGACGL